MADFALTSPAFEDGQRIPVQHTCEGDNRSPALSWSGVPDGARTLALVVDDPDAPGGTFTHWLAWAIEPGSGELPEGAPGPVEGANDFRGIGYGGPCPPPGHGPHRYSFRLYALDDELEPAAGSTKDHLEQAMEGHVLQVAELSGTYERGL